MGQGTWTNEQWAAINARDSDILVAAAAGSGKTAVLAERILSLISDGERPMDIDRLLVVTFTKAAATEMRSRIAEALEKKLAVDPENQHLRTQLIYLPHADIKTIHAFCLQVIREQYDFLEIDPAMRTADPSEARILQREVLDALFEERYEAEDVDFFALVECFGEDTKDTRLKELVLRIFTFLQGCPEPMEWLTRAAKAYHLPPEATLEDTPWMPVLRQAIHGMAEAAYHCLLQAKRIAKEAGIDAYSETIEEDLWSVGALLGAADEPFTRLYTAGRSIVFGRLRAYRGEETEAAERFKLLRNQAKKDVQKLQERFFAFSPEEALLKLRELYPVAETLRRILQQFSERYAAAKKEKLLLDFGDYEHFCLRALLEEGSTPEDMRPSQAALSLQARYDAILIDEYQDSNLIQEMLLRAVSREQSGTPNRFLVGDVKQSIYGFRLAMPEIFMEKYAAFPMEEGGLARKILLSKNFRSRKNVLDGINFLFYQLMTPELGGLWYDADAALYAGGHFPEGFPEAMGKNEVLLFDTAEDAEETEETEENLAVLSRRELEAAGIARRIQSLLSEGFLVLDKKTGAYRPIALRDITILLRSVRPWESVLASVFAKHGIPYYAESAQGYFDVPEVAMVLHFLQTLDNPRQDIPLIAMLHAPVFGFSAEELLVIRSYSEGCFLDALEAYCESEEDVLSERVASFLAKLTELRDFAHGRSISEILWYLYEKTGYFDYVGVTAGGILRQANLRLLLEKAERYEEGNPPDLFHFVRYIETIRESGEEARGVGSAGDAENVVQVMTIHKSKGLEFPVVIVADMGKLFNQQDAQGQVLLHQSLGLGLDYMDLVQRAIYPTLSRMAIAEQIKRENLSEEMRVLYVGLTRAKEKLILSGSVKNLAAKLESWAEAGESQEVVLPLFWRMRARSVLDWVMPALLRHPAAKKLPLQWQPSLPKPVTGLSCASDWGIFCFSKGELKEEREKQEEERKDMADVFSAWENGDNEVQGELAQQLLWRYPYEKEIGYPAKFSVSEVKRRQQWLIPLGESLLPKQRTVFLLPELSGAGRAFTSAEIGTLMHTFLELADFRQAYTEEDIIAAIAEGVAQEIWSEAEGDALDVAALATFFASPIAERLRKADEIQKERAFAMLMTPRALGLGESDEAVMINGMMDCFFREGKRWVLLDYKTDWVQDEGVLRERYAQQMALYAEALRRLTGHEVAESLIYSFSLGQMIVM